MNQSAENAVVLFDGNDLSNWTGRDGGNPLWEVAQNVLISRGNKPIKDDIISKQHFVDFFLNLEFMVPSMPNAIGQSKGNSGVFLQGRYEIQILDSFGINRPGTGDCAALYNETAPLVNACKPPLQWQTFEVLFRAPRFDSGGNMTNKARVSLLHNGIAVLNNIEIIDVSPAALDFDVTEPGPVLLQYHGDPISFRNVWVVPLPKDGSTEY